VTPRLAPLTESLRSTAFVFRGYNITNLGRTPELLEHPAYGPIVEESLRRGSELCSAVTGRSVDLVGRVRRREETRDLTTYAEDIALIVSVSLAQVRILEEQFHTPMRQAKLAFGYSLGEASALIAAGSYGLDLLKVPISLADDCVALAQDVTMGVLFSRGMALDSDAVNRLCLEINQEGKGVIGVSSVLSPNCSLLLGQGDTVDRFQAQIRNRLVGRVTLKKNPHRWPPLHTPITWQRAIPNRAAVMLHSIPGGLETPPLPILSSATGGSAYSGHNSRRLLHQWVDHPQQLWEQIIHVLSAGVRTVIHVGPDPNMVLATFNRLREDVLGQLNGHSPATLGRRVVSRMVRRPWLAHLLPSAAMLLRAPLIRHVTLEDWLLDEAGALHSEPFLEAQAG
jgi:[acyl-carrier-protein] S-malonyltransferase